MMDLCIDSVKKVTNKNYSELIKMREDNRNLEFQIKHVKELIDLRNPANASRNEVNSKNFDQSSLRSGGGTTSHAGSLLNER